MKTLLRNSLTYAFALFILTQIFPGVQVLGGNETYLIGGAVLAILFKVLKPILSIFSLPLNLLTFGTFSILVNVLILYLTTVLVPNISISAFTFPGLSIAGFIIPSFYLNTLFAYIASSALIVFLFSIVSWLIKR